jgi:tRNA/tmRNA/rRNA uracil-C5-methylase (TrmA/RlmC/RlmD family)
LRVAPENWEVPPDAFFQNNFFLLSKLVEVVTQCVTESAAKFLIDAYCGVGFFGIELASRVEKFVGIELDPTAIKAAKRNAQRRGITNGEFIAGHTEETFPRLFARFNPAETCLILDPPRTGCPRELLDLLRVNPPTQIIYVSCHPATLARDLNVLTAESVFELSKVVPLDMFPQTQHVECVADLRRAATS